MRKRERSNENERVIECRIERRREEKKSKLEREEIEMKTIGGCDCAMQWYSTHGSSTSCSARVMLPPPVEGWHSI